MPHVPGKKTGEWLLTVLLTLDTPSSPSTSSWVYDQRDEVQ